MKTHSIVKGTVLKWLAFGQAKPQIGVYLGANRWFIQDGRVISKQDFHRRILQLLSAGRAQFMS